MAATKSKPETLATPTGNQVTETTETLATPKKVTKESALKKAKEAISTKAAREMAKQGKDLSKAVDNKGRKFLLKEVTTTLQGEVIAIRKMAVREDAKGVLSFMDAIHQKKTFENGGYRIFFRDGVAWVSVGGKKPVLYTMLADVDLCAMLA